MCFVLNVHIRMQGSVIVTNNVNVQIYSASINLSPISQLIELV